MIVTRFCIFNLIISYLFNLVLFERYDECKVFDDSNTKLQIPKIKNSIFLHLYYLFQIFIYSNIYSMSFFVLKKRRK